MSWRWAFAIPVLIAAIAVACAPRLLPAGPTPLKTRLDVPGALLATTGLTLLSFGFVQVGDQPWTAPVVVIPLVAGLALLAAFVLVESRAQAPLVPLSFFASPWTCAVACRGMMLDPSGASRGDADRQLWHARLGPRGQSQTRPRPTYPHFMRKSNPFRSRRGRGFALGSGLYLGKQPQDDRLTTLQAEWDAATTMAERREIDVRIRAWLSELGPSD